MLSNDSIMGIDLSDPTLETVMEGVLSLCLHAAQFKGCPLCMHPLEHDLEVLSCRVDTQV